MIRAEEPSPLQLLRDALPSLSGGRLRVAEVLLRDPMVAGRSSITWLAAEAQTQPATVTRLSAALGYDGFPALRAAIANESGRERQAGWDSDIGTDISPEDSPEQIMDVLVGHEFRALRNAMASVDIGVLVSAADKIAAASRVEIYGEWGDRPPADELAMRLLRIGVPVWFHEGAMPAQVGARLLDKAGVAIALVRSGENDVAQTFLNEAASHGAATILITGSPKGPLTRLADITLFTGTGGRRTWTETFAGRASDHFVASVLWVLVAQRKGISFPPPP